MPRPVAKHALDGPPTISQLEHAPELAILAALAAVLDLATDAVLAANPQLFDDERPYWVSLPDQVPVADRLLRDAARLRRTMARYRQAIITPLAAAADPQPNDDHLF